MTLGYCQAFLLFVTKSLITYKIAWYNGKNYSKNRGTGHGIRCRIF
jgi:hypothetical protein